VFDDGDACDVDAGIEEILAVTLGAHPEAVDLGGLGGFGDVLGDEREVHAGGGGA
jgi:hypothetical protein